MAAHGWPFWRGSSRQRRGQDADGKSRGGTKTGLETRPTRGGGVGLREFLRFLARRVRFWRPGADIPWTNRVVQAKAAWPPQRVDVKPCFASRSETT